MARSANDPVPEFDNADDALAWMEAKLNGSWVDAITEEPKSIEQLRPAGLVLPSKSVFDTAQDQLSSGEAPTSTGYRPDMTADELAAFLDAMWKNDGESS